MPGISSRLISLVPFEDAVDARVAVVALGGIVADVAVAAVNLDVLVEDEVERLAAGDLQDRRLDGELFERGAGSAFGACPPCQRASIRPAVR